MTTKAEQAKEALYAYMDVEKDLSQPKILIHVLTNLIHKYSSSLPPDPNMDEYGGEDVIYVNEILDLINELENL